MKKFILYAAIAIALITGGCSKEDNIHLAGTYKGVFTLRNTDPLVNAIALNVPVSVSFKANNYSSTKNQNYVPAGGSGTFIIADSLFTCNDTNVWTANFDWHLVLNGQYKYTTKADSIFLTKQVGYSIYTYRLKYTKELND